MILLVTTPGTVVALTGGSETPGTIFLEGWQGFPAIHAIFTAVSGEADVSYSLMNTPANTVHTFVFGDAIGTLAIQGIAFARRCTGGTRTGLQDVARYFSQYRLTKRPAPVNIQLGYGGENSFRAHLVGFRFNTQDSEAQTSNFTLLFRAFPPGVA